MGKIFYYFLILKILELFGYFYFICNVKFLYLKVYLELYEINRIVTDVFIIKRKFWILGNKRYY